MGLSGRTRLFRQCATIGRKVSRTHRFCWRLIDLGASDTVVDFREDAPHPRAVLNVELIATPRRR